MRARLLLFALAGLTLVSARAVTQAQVPGDAHPGVAATVDACVPIDAAEFHRVLALELGPEVAYAREAPTGAAVTHVRIVCVEGGVELRLEDPVTRKSMARVLSLESLPDRSRTRLLALAAAEFVVASWIELNLQPAPVVEPAAPPPSQGAREAAAAIVEERHPVRRAPVPPPPLPVPPAWSLSGSFIAQAWTSHDTVLLGGELRIIHRTLSQLAWSAAIDLAVGRHTVPEGRVSIAHAGLGGALLLHGEWDAVRLYAGPGIRAGLVRIEGVPRVRDEAAGGGFFAAMPGPTGYTRVEVALSSRVLLALDLELGIVTIPARALGDDGAVVDLDGAWFTGGLAIGATF